MTLGYDVHTMDFPNRLRGTFAHSFAHRAKFLLNESSDFSYTSPVGEINLSLPSNLSNKDFDDYEASFVLDLAEQLSDDSIFYDVGAYIGYITKAAINCGISPDQIHSFEAVPYRYYVLEKNCGSVGVNTVNKYVGEKTSKRKISIDDYSNDRPTPDIVKIDVEGHEYEILKGMSDTIENFHPTMYVEVHPELLADLGDSESQTLQLLQDSDYELMFMRHRQDEVVWGDEPAYDESTLSPTYMLKAQPNPER
jgi:hypothetical protein